MKKSLFTRGYKNKLKKEVKGMKKELQVVKEQDVLGKQFRIYGDFENPLFLAKDVAEWIEHSNPSKMIKDAELGETEVIKEVIGTLTNSYTALFLTEDGLYEVLMQSRKPIAKAFKKEVKEILKSVRKHGAYMTSTTLEEMLANPDLLIGLATSLKEEQEKRKLAEAKVEEQKPKVLFAESVEASKSSCLIGELAKILRQNGVNIGQNRLFQWMRSNGYLGRTGERYNIPTQKSMDMELMTIKKNVINQPDGSVRTTTTTKITGKGQVYFVNKFLSDEAL